MKYSYLAQGFDGVSFCIPYPHSRANHYAGGAYAAGIGIKHAIGGNRAGEFIAFRRRPKPPPAVPEGWQLS